MLLWVLGIQQLTKIERCPGLDGAYSLVGETDNKVNR